MPVVLKAVPVSVEAKVITKLLVSVIDWISNSPWKSEADKLLVPGIEETLEIVTKSPGSAPWVVTVQVTSALEEVVVKR